MLAVANDESKEVLIFKMAVALGFDAPRAFVLVSSRSSRKADFGIQVCGRIMRIHRRVQGRAGLPALLDDGYVLLADPESQAGFVQAAQKIAQIATFVYPIGNDNSGMTRARRLFRASTTMLEVNITSGL